MTRILIVNTHEPEAELIAQAAAEIRRGQLVAFPTETVYGLGANALDAQAVERIFVAKGRPSTDPLIVHLASVEDLPRVARNIPEKASILASAFWPGPLTLVLPKQAWVPQNVTAGLGTVAVRVPSHPVALALLRACETPIAAPSANRFGHTSPTTARHVLDDLESRINLILDAGPATIGVESTVLDLTGSTPEILRPGGAPLEALEQILGPVLLRGESDSNHQYDAEAVPQPSPGLLPKHYAPHAKLLLILAPDPVMALNEIARLARLFLAEGRRVGLLLADEDEPFCVDLPVEIVTLGPNTRLETVARHLYAGMRTLDGQDVDVILARDFGEQGLGLAIRDRLRRAASRIIRL